MEEQSFGIVTLPTAGEKDLWGGLTAAIKRSSEEVMHVTSVRSSLAKVSHTIPPNHEEDTDCLQI